MIYASAKDWMAAPNKRVALYGMSGLGKTFVSNMLRETGNWFHYSVDFRIGTRYMGEHIVDNFKREAMRNPFLRELLMSDSIYIASNISFENLSPLSTYLGKPGDPAKGGIPLEDYITRQRQHRTGEIAATRDAVQFAQKAQEIYGYPNFVCDMSGSVCEVIDTDAPDPVMDELSQHILPVWIRGSEAHVESLVTRFDRAPKPMYYQEGFLRRIWADYLQENEVDPCNVDPDAFIRWGFRQLIAHRLPRYEAMAARTGLTVDADDVVGLRDAKDFEALIADAYP